MTDTLNSLPDSKVRLEFPQCAPGIGHTILSLDSPHLIDGVKLEASTLWPDDRGYFLEVLRVGQPPANDFPASSTQVSAALSYPGTIKAFHYHTKQTDLWVPVQGLFQVALVDLRPDSPTFGAKNTLYAGTLRPWKIRIPPGVGHGYKVIGMEPALLVYVTDQFYSPADEGRIAYNHPAIAYDWETQHK